MSRLTKYAQKIAVELIDVGSLSKEKHYVYWMDALQTLVALKQSDKMNGESEQVVVLVLMWKMGGALPSCSGGERMGRQLSPRFI